MSERFPSFKVDDKYPGFESLDGTFSKEVIFAPPDTFWQSTKTDSHQENGTRIGQELASLPAMEFRPPTAEEAERAEHRQKLRERLKALKSGQFTPSIPMNFPQFEGKFVPPGYENAEFTPPPRQAYESVRAAEAQRFSEDVSKILQEIQSTMKVSTKYIFQNIVYGVDSLSFNNYGGQNIPFIKFTIQPPQIFPVQVQLSLDPNHPRVWCHNLQNLPPNSHFIPSVPLLLNLLEKARTYTESRRLRGEPAEVLNFRNSVSTQNFEPAVAGASYQP